MTSRARRTIGAVAALAVTGAVAIGAWAPAAGAKGPPTPKASHFGHNSNRITNIWFPLLRGSVYVYDGQKDGKTSRDVMTVSNKVKDITGIRAAVINDRVFGYRKVNVAHQRRDPQSLLNWTERVIRMRKECPEISWGNFVILRTNVPSVLALRYDWRDTSLVTLHNFSDAKQRVQVKIGCPRDNLLIEVFDAHHSRAHGGGVHHIQLDAYAWRWFRVGGVDNALNRSDLDLTNPVR